MICVRSAVGVGGETICTDVGEVVLTESITALTCEAYEEDPDAR